MTITINPTCLPCAVCESHAPGLRDIIIRQGGRYVVSDWAYRENFRQIEAIAAACPIGAFEAGE